MLGITEPGGDEPELVAAGQDEQTVLYRTTTPRRTNSGITYAALPTSPTDSGSRRRFASATSSSASSRRSVMRSR